MKRFIPLIALFAAACGAGATVCDDDSCGGSSPTSPGALTSTACGNAIDVTLSPAPANGPGALQATVSVDMTGRGDELQLPCLDPSVTSSNDVLFKLELAQASELEILVDRAPGVDALQRIAVSSAPCASSPYLTCSESYASNVVHRLEAGTYYVSYDSVDNKFAASQTFTFDVRPAGAAPANDDCASTEQLVFTNGRAVVHADTTNASNSNAGAAATASPSCGVGAIYKPDVTYGFTLTQDTDVKVELRADGNASMDYAVVALQRNGCGPAADEVRCVAGDTLGVYFSQRSLPPGDYTIWVDGGALSVPGPFVLQVTLADSKPATSANDTCATAQTLVANAAPITVDLTAATAQKDYAACVPDVQGGEAYYQFTLPTEQYVTISAKAIGLEADPIIEIRAAACGTGAVVACLQPWDVTETSRNLPAGTYFAMIKQWGYSTEQYTVSLKTEPARLTPSNDTCAGATLVDFVANTYPDNTFTDDVELGLANADYQSDACFNPSNAIMPDVLYKVVIPANKQVSASAGPSAMEVRVSFNDSCYDAADKGCARYTPGSSPEFVGMPNVSNQAITRYVKVSGLHGGARTPVYLSLHDLFPSP